MRQRLSRPDDVSADPDNDDHNDDVDKRMERLQVIERNWDAASHYIDKLERDRTDCLQVRRRCRCVGCVFVFDAI